MRSSAGEPFWVGNFWGESVGWCAVDLDCGTGLGHLFDASWVSFAFLAAHNVRRLGLTNSPHDARRPQGTAQTSLLHSA